MFKKSIAKKDGFICFTGSYLEMYVPKSFIEKGLAEDVGNVYKVFGIIHLRTFDKSGKPNALETLNLPSMLNLYPSEKEDKNITLEGVEDRFLVLKFFNGDRIMDNQVKMDSVNCEIFLDLLFRGKIPPTIDYSKIMGLWDKNLIMNGVSFGIPATCRSVTVAEIYRDKNNPGQRYAKIVGKSFTNKQLDYIPSNTREMCARNSTFAALTFEDFDAMLTASLNINKYNRSETSSPIEKIIKM
jgi:hypothetical protein